MLPVFLGGVFVGAIVVHPLSHRRGARAAERDAAEVTRILAGVAVPVVRPALVATTTDSGFTLAPVNLNAGPLHSGLRVETETRPHRAVAAHASVRVATTPHTYQPRHGGRALVRAHLAAVAG
jgi:hypothetical protein